MSATATGTRSVRGQSCWDANLASGIAGYLRERAEFSGEQLEGGAWRHQVVSRLMAAANFVDTQVTPDDPRLVALFNAQTRVDNTLGVYCPAPGSQQQQVVALLGDSDVSSLEHWFTELALAASEDLLAIEHDHQARNAGANQELRDECNRLSGVEASNESLLEENDLLRVQLEAARREVAAAQKRIDWLASRWVQPNGDEKGQEAAEPDAVMARPAAKQRRKRVPDHKGIYSHENAAGEPVYEVGWTVDGKTQWKTVGLSLDDAIAFRDVAKAGGDPSSSEAPVDRDELYARAGMTTGYRDGQE